MSNLKRLGDCACVDISGVDKKSSPNEEKVLLCNFTDVYYNWAITETLQTSFMEATADENEISKFSVKDGQVAITKDSETRDDIGTAAYIAYDFDNVILGYHCALITPKKDILDGKYLNVLLHSKYAQKYFEHNASGSGQRYTLTNDVIADFPVPIIPIEEQKKIGNIFYNINKKIINNQELESNIEQLAELLYKYWFLQFEFPNTIGKPYKSSGGELYWCEELKREIPKGWSYRKIADILAKVPSSSKIKTNEYLDKGKYPVIDQSTDYIVGYTNEEDAILRIDDGCIVFGDHTCCAKYIKFPFARGADGTQIIFSELTEYPSALLYQIIKTTPLPDVGYSRHYMYLKDSTIICPSSDISQKYANAVNDLWNLKMNMVSQNYSMNELSDYLLPLILNGPIKCK